MVTYRFGTFETNSSSTHSMVICSEEEYIKWANGELLASRWEDGFQTKDDLTEDDYGWYDLDVWAGDLECDENSYTSPSGDKIRIICRYGYDG